MQRALKNIPSTTPMLRYLKDEREIKQEIIDRKSKEINKQEFPLGECFKSYEYGCECGYISGLKIQASRLKHRILYEMGIEELPF